MNMDNFIESKKNVCDLCYDEYMELAYKVHKATWLTKDEYGNFEIIGDADYRTWYKNLPRVICCCILGNYLCANHLTKLAEYMENQE